MIEMVALAGGLACSALWFWVVAPAVAVAFDVPFKRAWWRVGHDDQHLTRGQYVFWYGAFSWGVGMFLGFFAQDYFAAIVVGKHPVTTLFGVAGRLAIFVVGGIAVGLWNAPGTGSAGSQQPRSGGIH